MRPAPVPRSARFLALLIVAACLAVVGSRTSGAVAAPGARTGSIDARVILLGAPVPGVPVQARSTGQPGLDVWMDDSTAVVETTDTKGVAHFREIPVGRYHILAHCGRLPGDRIAGTISTKAEALPGTVAHSTLTLRPGGRIRGKVLEGGKVPAARVTVETQTTDALPSGCPVMDTRNPGPDGRFEVGRVPVDTHVWVKVYRPLGGGDIQVWRDFKLAKTDTLQETWNLPAIDSTQLATLRLGVRLDKGGAAEGGSLELSTIHPDGWRYFASFDFSAEDSLHTLASVPPGRYNLRATPKPGIKKWWNAPSESLVVAPGAKITRLLSGRAAN